MRGTFQPRSAISIVCGSQHSGSGRPIDRLFVQDYVSDIYSQMRLQGALFAASPVVAAVIACTGLFSLAVLTSQRRTREIGLRKTFGADVRDIVSLLIWQFLKPVLWANVVAWPVTILLLQRWLRGSRITSSCSGVCSSPAASAPSQLPWLSSPGTRVSPRARSRLERCVTSSGLRSARSLTK